MEFKFRAVDANRPPMAMTSATSRFTSEPPIPGYNVKSSSESTSNQTDDQLWQAFRRAIEKEHIRQEIIAAEAARRRELVAEVIREMSIDREMAMLRGSQIRVPYEDRPTYPLFKQPYDLSDPMRRIDPYGLATLPNPPRLQQISYVTGSMGTSVQEANKDKLIVLDRPDTKEAKRKAEAPPINENLLKKKPREQWRCSLCDVSLTSERCMNDHLQGKKHKAKEDAARAKQIPKSSTAVKLKGNSTKTETTKEKCKSQGEFKFWCEICQVPASSEAAMMKHELGKKHKLRIQKQKHPKPAASTSGLKH